MLPVAKGGIHHRNQAAHALSIEGHHVDGARSHTSNGVQRSHSTPAGGAILPVRAKVRDETGSEGYGKVRDEPLTEGDGERVDGLVMLV